MPSFFARKPMSQLRMEAEIEEGHEHHMRRSLGAFHLTMLGIGGIIGAGIFVLVGEAAAVHAGPAVLLSFILAGVACALTGLCYAEMAAVVPISGSAYTYSYATLGELVAWFIGWSLILEYGVGATAVAVGWGGYMVSLLADFGITFPPQFSAAPGTVLVQITPDLAEVLKVRSGWQPLAAMTPLLEANGYDPASLPVVETILNVPAMALVALLTILLTIGTKESANFNNVMVVIKIAVILLFIAAGIAYVNLDNWGDRFVPENSGVWGEFGWSGVLRAASLIFFAYIGFDAITTAAQETRNPQRDLPIGILASLLICTALYIILAFVLTGVVNYRGLAVPDPIAVGIDAIGMKWLKPIIKIGAVAGIASVVLVMLLAQTRIFMVMSRDGLLPKWVGRLHPAFRTPHITTILLGFAVMGLAGTVGITDAANLVSIGTLSAFTVVSVGVLVLRSRHPELHRPFKVPGVWIVAPLGIACCLALMSFLPVQTWINMAVWTAVGMTIYFLYGYRNSKIGQTARAGRQPLDLPVDTENPGPVDKPPASD